jgi:uncharacterized linocin/CFP29 family protein
LKQNCKKPGVLTKDELMEMLQRDGEKMNAPEIKEALEVLAGDQNFDLPEVIDSNHLIDAILGFEDMDTTNEKTVIS